MNTKTAIITLFYFQFATVYKARDLVRDRIVAVKKVSLFSSRDFPCSLKL